MSIIKSDYEITHTHKQEIFAMLNKISLFGGLTAGELECLIPLMTITTFKKGDIIFEQDGSPKNIYIVKEGIVKIIKEYDGKDIELAKFDAGNLFGETELIGIFKYIASAIAETDLELLIFPKSSLYSLHSINLKLFSKIILNIAREACRRTASADEYWIEELAKLRRTKNNK
jgi:CRP-like cAMP-binding protein